MTQISSQPEIVPQANAQEAVFYCVVVVTSGHVAYLGNSLAMAAAQFNPGCVAGAAFTSDQAERLAQRIASQIAAWLNASPVSAETG